MTTSNDQEVINLFAACVYKHNGRFNYSTITKIALNDNDYVKVLEERIPNIIFINWDSVNEFTKSSENTGFTVEKERMGNSNRYVFSKSLTRVYNDFEQLKNEYNGDLNLVKMIDGRFYFNTTSILTADISLEKSVFRVPFNEYKIDCLAITNQEYLDNLKSGKLTINWACLFENYEKFDSINNAVREFIHIMEDNRPDGYNVFHNSTGYDCRRLTVMLPIVTAELNAYIASKKAAEYTIDQAKKDLESGQQMIDQGQALIKKAASFFAK